MYAHFSENGPEIRVNCGEAFAQSASAASYSASKPRLTWKWGWASWTRAKQRYPETGSMIKRAFGTEPLHLGSYLAMSKTLTSQVNCDGQSEPVKDRE